MWFYLGQSMATAKSIGYKTIAITLLPSGSTNDTQRLLYNDIVRTQWPTVADILVDLTTLPFTAPTDYTNSTYYIGSSGFYYPSLFNSTQCSELILRAIRLLSTTNLISK
jgi:hypothetical protein